MKLAWRRPTVAAWGALVLVVGPFDLILTNTATVPDARASARLVYAPSPFGVAVTVDGRASYEVQITATGLPEPASIGAYRAYVAWEVTTDLSEWTRLGTITNGLTVVGPLERNKFMLVVTAEASDTVSTRSGPTVLHGISPSSWLQTFLTHPLFRGVSP